MAGNNFADMHPTAQLSPSASPSAPTSGGPTSACEIQAESEASATGYKHKSEEGEREGGEKGSGVRGDINVCY